MAKERQGFDFRVTTLGELKRGKDFGKEQRGEEQRQNLRLKALEEAAEEFNRKKAEERLQEEQGGKGEIKTREKPKIVIYPWRQEHSAAIKALGKEVKELKSKELGEERRNLNLKALEEAAEKLKRKEEERLKEQQISFPLSLPLIKIWRQDHPAVKALEELKRKEAEEERLKKEGERQRQEEKRQASRLEAREALKEVAEELKGEKAEREGLEEERWQRWEEEIERREMPDIFWRQNHPAAIKALGKEGKESKREKVGEERRNLNLKALEEAAEELSRKKEEERLEKEQRSEEEGKSLRTCPFCHGRGTLEKGSTAACLVCKGKGLVTVKEPAVKCPVCQGKGRKSGSSVYCLRCKGTGFITVEEKPKEEKSKELVITCPFCNGRGTAKKGGTATCLVCKGNGMVRVKKPAVVCPVCQGAGRKSGSSSYCLKCKGTGFVTVEGERPGKGRAGGRPPKLGDKELEGLRKLLKEKESWETKEVVELIKKEFDVKISMGQVRRILKDRLDMVFQTF